MAVRMPGGKKSESRLDWRKIRIPHFVLRGLIVAVVVGSLVAGGSIFWARHQGEESFVGRLLTVVSGMIDKRIKLMTAGDDEEDILEERFARIAFYTGNVEIQRASDLGWKGATEKMRLESGDRVRTFSNSRAEISFDDGTTLRVKADSLIVIGELTENVRTKVTKSSVRLLVSSIEADIKQSVVKGSQFKLELPTAVAEVEKARFTIDIDKNDDSQVRVLSGTVGIDTGTERVELNDRKTIMISALKKLSETGSLVAPPRVEIPAPLESFVTNTDSRPVEVRWASVPDARTYRLEVATDRYFDQVVFSKANLRETSFLVPELGGNVFYLRVAALDSRQVTGAFSDPLPFRVIVDRVPPIVDIKKFVVLRSGGSKEVLVHGETEPTASVEIGGRAVNVDENGFFSTVVREFSPGQQEVEIVVKDRAGNVRNVRRSVSS